MDNLLLNWNEHLLSLLRLSRQSKEETLPPTALHANVSGHPFLMNYGRFATKGIMQVALDSLHSGTVYSAAATISNSEFLFDESLRANRRRSACKSLSNERSVTSTRHARIEWKKWRRDLQHWRWQIRRTIIPLVTRRSTEKALFHLRRFRHFRTVL